LHVNLGQARPLSRTPVPEVEQVETSSNAPSAKLIAMMTGIAASPTFLISVRRLSAARRPTKPSSPSSSPDFSSSS
jgi:hypothetical protein